MTNAILTNKITGAKVRVHATTDHPCSSYGIAVWVDDDDNAYCEVNGIIPNPFYDIVEEDEEPYET